MRYHKITSPDIENGLGFRVTLWVSGCNHGCPGCHNPETHDPLSGKEFTEESMNELLSKLSLPYIKGLCVSGGDPLSYYTEDLLKILQEIKSKFPKKDVWLYTGYIYEELVKDDLRKDILNYVDVLVDGPFILAQKDLTIAFRGSRNQRILIKDQLTGIFFEDKTII